MLEYKIKQKKNPVDKNAPAKYYAVPVTRKIVDTQELCKTATRNSTVSVGEMINVFENLMESVPSFLLDGNSVRLGRLGTLRVSFGSDGADSEKGFRADMIREPKVVFTASKELREEIRKEASFRRISEGAASAGEDEEEGGSGSSDPSEESPDPIV